MMRRTTLRVAEVGGCAACGYLNLVRPWHLRWGATDEEVREPLNGDDEVPSSTVQATRAITIDAPPKDVWPWVAQIGYVGYGRAGYYAFDFWDADSGRGRSSWRLIPEAQELHVGLRIGEEGFTVRSFEPNEHLVLAYHYPSVEWVLKDGLWPKFGHCSWSFVLRENPEGGTRLVVRMRVTLGGIGVHLLWWPLFEVGDFLQHWRMLPGIKRRAERLLEDPRGRAVGGSTAPTRDPHAHKVRDGEAQCRSPRVPSAPAPAKSPRQPDARVPYEDPKLERNAMSTVKYRLSLAVQGSTSAFCSVLVSGSRREG